MGYGCEYGAKSSTLVSVIPRAQATGKCEIRPNSTVFRVVTNRAGRVSEVLYYDAKRREHSQRARAFILSANGAETPRLLFMSANPQHPFGLANSSGKVGKYLMFNTNPVALALFDQPLNEYKSVQVTRIIHDFYDTDPKRGFYGGGGLDARMFFGPLLFALNGGSPGSANWGADFKRTLHHEFTRTMMINGHTTSLAMERNNITLDPTAKDKFGLPAIRMTYKDHSDDIKIRSSCSTAAWTSCTRPTRARYGTGRWGKHRHRASAGHVQNGQRPAHVSRGQDHRTHDVRNLFICDGSSMVTSGRGQPTMTIQALAFRAGHHIAEFAKRGEI
jgi:choline dehydrogenase-like flavoprotein